MLTKRPPLLAEAVVHEYIPPLIAAAHEPNIRECPQTKSAAALANVVLERHYSSIHHGKWRQKRKHGKGISWKAIKCFNR